MQERKINLIDLMVEVLLRWRVVIVWMLAGGIILGGLNFVNAYLRAGDRKEQNQEEDEEPVLLDEEYLRERLTELQERNVMVVLDFEEYAQERQQYMKESILMHIDALKIPQVKLTFLVMGEDAEKSASIEQIYEDAILGGFIGWMNEGGKGDDCAALSEVINISRSSSWVSGGGDSFSVSIEHVTKEQCNDLADQIIAYVDARQNEIQDLVGPHTIEVVNRSFLYIIDTGLMHSQRSMQSDTAGFLTSAAQLKAGFSEEEWDYYYFITSGEVPEKDAPKESETVAAASPSVSVKYIVFGMVFFAFLYIFYVVIKYVFNNRLQISDDVKELYGIAQLAFIPSPHKPQKLFGFVDRQILKIQNRNKRIFSEEEAMGLAAAALKIQMKKEGLKEIVCVGCSMKERVSAVAELLQNMLEKENINLNVIGDVLYNYESMEQLQDAKAVFLLEKAGETLCGEIQEELELLRRQEIKTLGIIVVE